MSAPVGRPALVARTESVRFGVVPVHPLQKRLISARVSRPVTEGVNVWPPHVVIVIPTPLVPRVVFCWSILGALVRITSPGLLVRSQLVKTPARKSACEVSVMQPLVGASINEKFCVVVRPSLITILATVRELYP